MNNRIVIWGDDHHNALGLLRMLGDRGFDVFFLVQAPLSNIATASIYCKDYKVVNNVQEGLDYLLEHYTDKENKVVLLVTYDMYSEAANKNIDILSDFFYVAGPSEKGILKKVDDKYTMGMMAEECGIIVPKSLLYPQNDLSKVSFFPAVVKSSSPTAKDIKFKIVKDEKELIKTSKSFFLNKRYVIQQYIQKKADGLIYGCRTWDGRMLLAGICVRYRWSDDGCGSFGYLTPDIPEYINKEGIELFLQKIDFRGLFSVEYALTDNEAYFYEFNLRNDGTSVLFYNAGSNIALAYVNSCFGISEDVPVKVTGKQYLMNEFWDKFNVKDGVISKRQWEEDRKKATIWFYYDPDDMKPYEVQKALTFKRKLRRVISKSWINKQRLQFRNYLRRKR